MSILDTFYILFKTDGREAAEDIKDVDKAADDAADSLKAADAAGEGMAGSLARIAAPAAIAAAAMAAVGAAIKLAIERVDAIDEIGDTAGKLRSTAQDYDAFVRAVRSTGGTIADASANLANFGDKLNDAAARPDGPNAKNFAKWGILFKDAKGDAVGAVDGILALAKSLEGLDQAQAIGRLRKLGIQDADTIAFLLEGKQAILDKMDAEKRAGVVTDRQIQIAGEYQAAIGQLSNAQDSLSNTLMEAITPAITAGIRAITEAFRWMAGHKELVKGFFIGISGVITAVYLPAMMRAAAATIAATWPFLAIAAAIIAVGAAFALAYEDVVAFMDGQPSLIGELVDRYEWFAAVVRGIGKAYEFLKGVAVAAVDGIAAAWDLFVQGVQAYADALTAFWGSFKPIWDALKDVISAVGDVVSALADRIGTSLGAALDKAAERFSEIWNAASEVFQKIFGDFDSIKEAVSATAEAIKNGFTAAFNAVLAVWNSTIGLIAGKISAIADSIRNLAASITNMPQPSGPTAVNDNGQTPANQIGAIGGKALGGGKPAANQNAAPPAAPAPPKGARRSSAAALPAEVEANVAQGQRLINSAATAPISTQTAATVAAPVQKTKVVHNTAEVGNITIHTQAVDAKGIASAIRAGLSKELREASAQFDDGVAR